MIRSSEDLHLKGKVKSAATRGPGVSWLGSAPQVGVFSRFQYPTPPLSGGWTESYQARRYFAVRVAVDEALLLWAASRRRAKLPIPQWLYQVMAVGRLVSIVVKS